jgi:putative oxidoreductase
MTAIPDFLPKLLIAAYFLVAGLFNIRSWTHLRGEVAGKGVPLPAISLGIAILAQFAGSLLLFIPGLTAYGALALIVFTVTGTFLFHAFWRYPAGHERFIHRNFFLGNFAVVGGLLLLMR